MKNYAMILRGVVIDVLYDQSKEPHYPPDIDKNPVIAIECDDTVEIGMVYDMETKEFSCLLEEEPPKTQLDNIESKLDDNSRASESVLRIIMSAIADQYEEQRADTLATMEAQAIMYEELLLIKAQLGGTK